jgi:polar amino acid transport system permease protein
MAQDLSASTFQPLQLFAAAGLLYLVINWVVAWCGMALEKSFRWGKA